MSPFAILCAVLPAVALSAAGRDVAGKRVLIVHDTPEPMKVLSEALASRTGAHFEMVEQDKLPQDLSLFVAVINYVHGPLIERVERSCMVYAREGGRLILLHHAISSSKRNNPEMLKELKSAVPPGGREKQAFYVDRGTLTLVNVSPEHFITTHGITYADKVLFPAGERERDAFSFENTEVFLNMVFPPCPERELLFGIAFRDKEGTRFHQGTGGWVMKTGKGYTFYFQPGHEARDFAIPAYQQIIVNCIIWQP